MDQPKPELNMRSTDYIQVGSYTEYLVRSFYLPL